MKHGAKQGIEEGAAEFRVRLSDGNIEVLHSECGSLLASMQQAPKGTWDKIWRGLEAAGLKREFHD